MITGAQFPETVRVQNPPKEKPLLIYDGECQVCRRWVAWWNAATGDRVEYGAFQTLATRFPEVPLAWFENGVQWIDTDGRVFSGADAVFRIYDMAERQPRMLRLLRTLPGFIRLARVAYAFLARHRRLLSVLTNLLWSRPS